MITSEITCIQMGMQMNAVSICFIIDAITPASRFDFTLSCSSGNNPVGTVERCITFNRSGYNGLVLSYPVKKCSHITLSVENMSGIGCLHNAMIISAAEAVI